MDEDERFAALALTIARLLNIQNVTPWGVRKKYLDALDQIRQLPPPSEIPPAPED